MQTGTDTRLLCFFVILGMLVLLVSVTGETKAYHHINAHIDINGLSTSRFVSEVNNDVMGRYTRFSHYDFNDDEMELEGYDVTQTGKFEVEEGLRQGTYKYWIKRGGFTADEPEYLSALRHFYDPLKIQTDKSTGQRVAYLTDHVSELLKKAAGKFIDDPKMDAREWALLGPPRNGYKENKYSLRKGLEYMRRAWLEDSQKMKNRFFAAAWRSCGETMHLLSDMTVPAHVRNDAHPAETLFSGLRYDPYEHYVTSTNARKGDVIRAYYNGAVPKEVSRDIDEADDAFSLFHRVALFTNQHFFSADTLSGTNEHGERVRSANGMRDYPSPSLDTSRLGALRVYEDKSSGYAVAHGDWAENSWWNIRNYLKQKYAPSVSASFLAVDSYEDVALSQAEILLPVAVYANCRLLELFIPEVKVELEQWDPERREITGTITHTVSGVYADKQLFPSQKPLVFNSAGNDWSKLTCNYKPYFEKFDGYTLEIVNNKISLKLGSDVDVKHDGENKVTLKLFFGGFWVSSNELVFENQARKSSGTKTATLQGDIPRGNVRGSLDVSWQERGELSRGNRFNIEDWAYQVELISTVTASIANGRISREKENANLSKTLFIASKEPVSMTIRANARLADTAERTDEQLASLYRYTPRLAGYLLKGSRYDGIRSADGQFTITVNRSLNLNVYALVQTEGTAKFFDTYNSYDPIELQFDSNKLSEVAIGTIIVRFNEGEGAPVGSNPINQRSE